MDALIILKYRIWARAHPTPRLLDLRLSEPQGRAIDLLGVKVAVLKPQPRNVRFVIPEAEKTDTLRGTDVGSGALKLVRIVIGFVTDLNSLSRPFYMDRPKRRMIFAKAHLRKRPKPPMHVDDAYILHRVVSIFL